MYIALEEAVSVGKWREVGSGVTDADGRLRSLVPPGSMLRPGVYRLLFDTTGYFEEQGIDSFYPKIVVIFQTSANEPHYHVPLLLSPYGYSTYRGS